MISTLLLGEARDEILLESGGNHHLTVAFDPRAPIRHQAAPDPFSGAIINVRDVDLAPLATALAPTELEIRREWLHPGGWTITVPATNADGSPTVAALALTQPGAGIHIRSRTTGNTICSGPAHLTRSGTQTAARRELRVVDGTPTEVVTVSGIDDLGSLAYAPAWVNPTGGPTTSVTHDTHTGIASTVALAFIDANIGPAALPARRLAGLTLPADPHVGGVVTANARFDNLLDLLRDICTRGGITLDAHQTGRNITLSISATRDMSTEVLFSTAAGTLAEAIIDSSLTRATHVVVAGQGEGVDRVFRHIGPLPGTNPVRRIEVFLDRRDLATIADLDQAGLTYLRENAGTISLTFTPNSTSSGPVYGRDYQLGDWVAVEVMNLADGSHERRIERLVAVTEKWTPDGIDTTLTVGDHEPFGDLATIRSIRDTTRALSLLQRS